MDQETAKWLIGTIIALLALIVSWLTYVLTRHQHQRQHLQDSGQLYTAKEIGIAMGELESNNPTSTAYRASGRNTLVDRDEEYRRIMIAIQHAKALPYTSSVNTELYNLITKLSQLDITAAANEIWSLPYTNSQNSMIYLLFSQAVGQGDLHLAEWLANHAPYTNTQNSLKQQLIQAHLRY